MNVTQHVTYVLSPRLCFFLMLNPYLFVYRDDSLASSMVIMGSMVSMRSEEPTKVVVLLWSSVACFGVKVSVTFHLTCVSISFSSVWVAEWPPFGKELLTRFTIYLVPLYLAEVIWVLIAQVPGHCILLSIVKRK